MVVMSSFDQWEKDVFFKEAEEVQESADVMESLYRTWHRHCTSGLCSKDLEELQGELQTALGTAKWQLEQFQQAVTRNHEKYPLEENTISRHRQFVSAIESQIKRVDLSLADVLAKEGKSSLTWVKVEEGERDDFVAFLSSDSLSSKQPERKQETLKEVPCKKEKEVVIRIESLNGEQEAVPNFDRLSSNDFLKGLEALPRVKLLRNNVSRLTDEESMQKPKNSFSNYLDLKGVAFISQRFTKLSERNMSYFYRRKEDPKISNLEKNCIRGNSNIQHCLQLSQLIRATFLLLLSILLIGTFVIYAT